MDDTDVMTSDMTNVNDDSLIILMLLDPGISVSQDVCAGIPGSLCWSSVLMVLLHHRDTRFSHIVN